MDVALVILPRETSGRGVHCPTAVIFSCFLPYLWNSNSSAGKRSNSTHARILPFLSPPLHITPLPSPVLICSLFCVVDRSLTQEGAMSPVTAHCNITLMKCFFLSAPTNSRFMVFESLVPFPKRHWIIYSVLTLFVTIYSHSTPPPWIWVWSQYLTLCVFFVLTPSWSCTLSIIQSISVSDSLHTGHYLSRINEWQVTNRSVFEGLL